MSASPAADVVFVIDASDSMSPCIEGVRRHLCDFLEIFRGDANTTWDVRFDFVVHQSSDTGIHIKSIYESVLWSHFYKGKQGRFFTGDVGDAQAALARIHTSSEERPLIALDFALDAPWRARREARRVVIFLTDEAYETSAEPAGDLRLMAKLCEKVQAIKAQLFLVAPDSDAYEQLAACDGADWERVNGGDGLASVDLRRVLEAIAKTITKSQTPLGEDPAIQRGLFGQPSWGEGTWTDQPDRS